MQMSDSSRKQKTKKIFFIFEICDDLFLSLFISFKKFLLLCFLEDSESHKMKKKKKKDRFIYFWSLFWFLLLGIFNKMAEEEYVVCCLLLSSYLQRTNSQGKQSLTYIYIYIYHYYRCLLLSVVWISFQFGVRLVVGSDICLYDRGGSSDGSMI